MIYLYQVLIDATNKKQIPLHIACQHVIHLLFIVGPQAVHYVNCKGNLPLVYALKHKTILPSNAIA